MQWSLDELLLHPLYRAVLLILKLGDVIFSLKTLQILFLKYLQWSTRSYVACPALLPFLLSHGLLGSPRLVTVATLACILFVLLDNLLPTSGSSLVAQLVKNPPAMRETWVWSLDWEDPLEKGKATTPVFWPGEFLWGCKEFYMTEWLSLSFPYLRATVLAVPPAIHIV